MYVQGNLPALEIPRKMAVVLKKDEEIQQFAVYWEINFTISIKVETFTYKYMVRDERSGRMLGERPSILRHCNLNLNRSVDYPNTISFTLKKNVYKRVDCNFTPEFHVNELDQLFLLGPPPASKQDVRTLSDNGVKCVLHLGEDSPRWQETKAILAKHGLIGKRVEVPKKLDVEDTARMFPLLTSLELLTQKYGKCFMFSTPFRTSQTIPTSIAVLYYWHVKGKSLEEAFSFVETRTYLGIADRNLIESLIEARKGKPLAKEIEGVLPKEKPVEGLTPANMSEKHAKRDEVTSSRLNVCQ
jgi:hypothetical protein